MKRDDLQTRMRRFEDSDDPRALPGVFLVARADGRNFTSLTRETLGLTEPFSERVRDAMLAALRRLFESGLRVVYGYTQSDELSVLLHLDDDTFDRRLRKLGTVIASEVGAAFSLQLGVAGAFDCRVLQLPRADDVLDYFTWRMADATRNALSAWCYWQLRGDGLDANAVTSTLEGLSNSEKNELLFQRGINFNDVPVWQRRGVGMKWADVVVDGLNPKTGARTQTSRRRLTTELELSLGDSYRAWVRGICEASG